MPIQSQAASNDNSSDNNTTYQNYDSLDSTGDNAFEIIMILVLVLVCAIVLLMMLIYRKQIVKFCRECYELLVCWKIPRRR